MTIKDEASRSEEFKFNFWKGNYDKIRNSLHNTDWYALLDETDVNKAWSAFQTVITGLIIENVPRKAANNDMLKRNKRISKETRSE